MKRNLIGWTLFIVLCVGVAYAVSPFRQDENGMVPAYSGVDIGTNSNPVDVIYTNMLDLGIETVAAAGNSQATATAIAEQVAYVTASDGTKGVILPDSSIGTIHVVHNTVNGQNLALYPPASGTINGGAANTAVTVAGEETAVLIKAAANTWFGGVAVDF